MKPDAGAPYQSILVDLALLLSGRGKVTDVFASFAERLLAVTRFEHTALLIAETDPRYFRVAGRYPSWEGSIPADAVLNEAAVPIPWRESGVDGIEYTTGPDDPEAARRQFRRGFLHGWAAGLTVNGVLYGVLTVAGRATDPVTAEERKFLRSAAQLLADCCRQEHLLSRADHAAAQNQVLNDLALLLHAGEPLAALFDRMPALVTQIVDLDHFSAWVATDDGFYRMAGSYPEPASAGDAYSITASQAETIFGAPGGLLEVEANKEMSYWPERYAATGLSRFLAAGLAEGAERLGFICMGRVADSPFTPGERQFVMTLAAMIGQAEANHRRLDQLAAANARARVLNEMTLVLNAGEPVEGLFHRLTPMLEQALEFDYVSLLVATDDPGQLRQVGSRPQLLREPGELLAAADVSLDSIAASPGLVQYVLDADTRGSAAPLVRAGLIRGASIALREGVQPVGLLTIARRREAPWTAIDQEFIEVLATIIGQAVANQRRLQRVATEAARAGILNDLTILLNAGEPVEALFDRLLPLLEQAIEFDYAGLLVAAEGPGMLRQVGSRPELLRQAGELVGIEEAGQGPISAASGVVQTNLGHAATGGLEYAVVLRREGILREASIALRDGDETVGIFSVCRRRDAAYSLPDVEFIETLATILGQAVAGQRRLEASRAETSRSMLLNQIALLVNSGEPPKRYFDSLGELLHGAIGFSNMAVLLPEADGARLRVEASLGSHKIPVGQTFRSKPLLALLREQDGRLVHQYLAPAMATELTSVAARHGIARFAASVLRDGNDILGIILLGREPDTPFPPGEMALLELVCTLLGYALADDRRLRQSRSEAARSKLLSELGMRLSAGEPTSEMVKVVAGLLRPIVAWDRASLLLTVDDSVTLRVAASIPGVHLREGEEHPLSSLPLAPEQLVATASWRYRLGELDATLTRGSDPAPDGWGITASLHDRDQFLGVFSLWREADEPFTDQERDLVEFLATLLAQSVAGENRVRRAQDEAARIARQRALYDLILRSLTEGVILLDRNAKVVFTNAQGRLLVDAVDPTKTSGGDLANIAALLPGDLASTWMRAVRSGEGAAGRASIVRDGAPWWLDYEIVSLDDPEYRMLVVISDVTEAVQREEENEQHRQQMQQASRLAALGELISGVAHELNNPLTAILGFAEVLSQAPGSESFGEEVSIIQAEALRARNIVRDLLFITRPGPVESAPVAMAQVIAHVERLRRTAWARGSPSVIVDVPPEGGVVWGNENQLTQVLLNLVTNAEFAVAGRPDSEIRISVVSSADTVELIVSDSGSGMSPEITERIFEPFFTTKQGAGTGLGLSLSYSIIQSHQGRIEVESELGVGTRFRVILPARLDVDEVRASGPGRIESGTARVLVVDDEPSLRKVCQRLIQSMGHACEVASTSTEAISLAAKQEFDVVLCDYRLAHETADDVIAGLSEAAPHLIARTVIATGATTDPGVVRLTGQHRLRLIAKPYGADELAEVISAVLRGVPLEV